VEGFLLKRGLELNPKKTRITNIQAGIDLLGFQLKRYPYKPRLNNYNGQETILVVKPSKKGVIRLKEKIKEATKDHNRPIGRIIRDLNPILRG
jgi:RNA-directed DNA polymerase